MSSLDLHLPVTATRAWPGANRSSFCFIRPPLCHDGARIHY